MPRYYFDIHDGFASFDDTGSDLPGIMEARQEAMKALPVIAAEEIPMGEDRRHFTVLVKDDEGAPVYSATLSFVGMWLSRAQEKTGEDRRFLSKDAP